MTLNPTPPAVRLPCARCDHLRPLLGDTELCMPCTHHRRPGRAQQRRHLASLTGRGRWGA